MLQHRDESPHSQKDCSSEEKVVCHLSWILCTAICRLIRMISLFTGYPTETKYPLISYQRGGEEEQGLGFGTQLAKLFRHWEMWILVSPTGYSSYIQGTFIVDIYYLYFCLWETHAKLERKLNSIHEGVHAVKKTSSSWAVSVKVQPAAPGWWSFPLSSTCQTTSGQHVLFTIHQQKRCCTVAGPEAVLQQVQDNQAGE